MTSVLDSRRAVFRLLALSGVALLAAELGLAGGALFDQAARAATEAPRTTLRVASAVSLRPVLLAVKPAFEKANPGTTLEFNFGSSGQLRAQIAQGAPADLFLAADQEDAKALAKAGFAAESAMRTLAHGKLVAVVPTSLASTMGDAFARDGLAALKGREVKKIATGTPASVPLGRYAMEAVRKADLESALKDKLVFAENARQALTYVERADAQAALVYASDARASKDVAVVWDVPSAWHAPITYVGVPVKGTRNGTQADAFLAHLTSESGREAFRSAGFTP